ncbi:unnamed protein product [Rotaria sp. Silwood1]|nr:unnamed protein product [Rotaria sp. Silwood1]CAF0894616.1 unnamed protein product [Rotaria sp. Silwood1]CAF0908492.1 unnamed protein product [Rotaria sp. Silwood1]CAF3352218.1 unnamed protein product [Rotaria sp. Silwood1]CAF3391006.1 unnamed protein product [Rotaria sp. Silwood1]
MSASQKRVWPELVGKDINSALKTLKEESADIDHIETLRDNSPVTLDFCPTRILVFVDEKNIVTVEPRIG